MLLGFLFIRNKKYVISSEKVGFGNDIGCLRAWTGWQRQNSGKKLVQGCV